MAIANWDAISTGPMPVNWNRGFTILGEEEKVLVGGAALVGAMLVEKVALGKGKLCTLSPEKRS